MKVVKSLKVIIILVVMTFCRVFVLGQEADQNHEKETQAVIEQFKSQHGFLPKPLLVLSERPDAVPAFMKYGTSLMLQGPLTMRELNLVTLSAAVALKSPGCIQNQIKKLKKMGVSEDEIIQTVLIAAVLGNTSILQEAHQALEAESILKSN